MGPGLAEAGHRAIDDPRVETAHVFVGETEPREIADLEILDQHVAPGREIADQLPPGGLGEIHRHRLLAAIRREEVGRLAGPAPLPVAEPGRSPGARLVADSRALHLDDFGAQVGEALGGPRARECAGEIEYTEVLERTGHAFGGYT